MKPIKSKQLLALILMFAVFSTLTAQQNKERALKKDKILFINLFMKKESKSTYQINLLKQKVVFGKFKQRFEKQKSIAKAKDGDVILTLLDKKQNVIHTIVIDDPLSKSMEYPTNKGFEKGNVNLKEAKFPVRLQLDYNAAYISVQRMNSSNKTSSKGLTFKINQL